jgi:hypothetical protein
MGEMKTKSFLEDLSKGGSWWADPDFGGEDK